MARLDDVLDQLRERLGSNAPVPDVAAAVDAMARAYRHAASDGDWLSGSEVARMMGLSRQAVNQSAGRGSLLAVADGEGVRYPKWQFVDGTPAGGLRVLVRAAREAGVEDAVLIGWIAGDDDRVDTVRSGRAPDLIGDVPALRRRRTAVARRRTAGSAPPMSDTKAR